MKTSLLVVLSLVALALGNCPSLPRTGCFQSTNVDATIRSNIFGNINAYDWIWTNDGEDYGLNVTYPSSGNFYLLCVYDGNTVTQTETVSPNTGSQLGFFPAVVSANMDISTTSPKKIQIRTYGIGRLWAQGVSSATRAAAITQLIDYNSNSCWSRAFTFVNSNPPPVKPNGYLDLSLTGPILNKLAARYNAKSNGQPLNMISFSAALGPADLFQKHATASLTGFDVKAHFSTFHVLGWYGGLWFLRDGFSGIPPGAAGPTLDAVDNVYSSLDELIASQNPTAMAAYLESTTLNPSPTPPTSDTVGNYGYNTGYSLQVIEAGAALAASTGNSGFLAPSGALSCPGVHPSCTFSGGFPNCPVPTGTSLVGCVFTPQNIPATNSLQSSLTTYKNSFPTPAANLLTRQNNGEPIGRQVWLFLSSRIASSATVYQTLYGVNNAFLETLQTTALLSFHYAIQTPGSAASLSAATRATISTASGQGWLTSYNFGLYVSSGGLPTFGLGTTPITVAA